MGTIQKVLAMSHSPEALMYVDNPESQPNWEHMRQYIRALRELGEEVNELKPDRIILVFDEHYVRHTDDFLVINGDRLQASLSAYGVDYEGEHAGDPELAQRIFDAGQAAGLPMRMAAAPDYGIYDFALMIPLLYMKLDLSVPIVPVHTHYVPEITLDRCLRLGETIREVVEASDQKAVLIVNGGLSHYIMYPWKWPDVDVTFDKMMIDLLEQGRGRELAKYTHSDMEVAGNDEIRQWLVAVGATDPGTPARLMAYEAAEYFGIGIGQAVVDLTPAPAVVTR